MAHLPELKQKIYEYVALIQKKGKEVGRVVKEMKELSKEIKKLEEEHDGEEIPMEKAAIIAAKKDAYLEKYNRYRQLRKELLDLSDSLYMLVLTKVSTKYKRIRNDYIIYVKEGYMEIYDGEGNFIVRVFPKTTLVLDVKHIFARDIEGGLP